MAKLTWLDDEFTAPDLKADGVAVAKRPTHNYVGFDVVDDGETLTFTAPGGGDDGKTIKPMADADQTLTDAEGRMGLVQTTGALTANRKLTFAAPAAGTNSYSTPVLNTCSGASIVVNVGTGPSIAIEPGSKSLVQITATGVTVLIELPLDPRDFGCPWNGTDDDLPGLILMQQAIPADRHRKTVVQLPKGQGYCSDNLEIFRKLKVVGQGKAHQNGLDDEINGLRFPPLKGIVIHGTLSAAQLAYSGGGDAHNTEFAGVNLMCQGAIVSDHLGNWGRAMNHIDTIVDAWLDSPAVAPLGACLVMSAGSAAVQVGSAVGEYYGDGHARNATHVVWFRCTTSGTKGTSKPTAMEYGGAITLADIGTTVAAVGGTAVWTVESIPKDYANGASVVVGQRVFLPGDNAHVFKCLDAGAGIMATGEATTIDVSMNGLALTTLYAGIVVASTAGFPPSGIIRVVTSVGFQFVTYSGKTSTTFTGCDVTSNLPTPLAGTLATGGAVTGPYKLAPWGVPVISLNQMNQPSHRGEFYDVATVPDGATIAAALPQATLTVASTAGFTNAGTLHIWTGAAYTAVAYTGRTDTTFTGCTGGTGTIGSGAEIGQGCFWQEEFNGAFSVLASWVTIHDCQINGAANGACWVNPNYKRGPSGGSHYFSFIDNYIQNCGSGFKVSGYDCNGGETDHNQYDFIGGGRTNTDGPAYLNIIAAPVLTNWGSGRFGNAGEAVTDRELGLNIHKNSYVQFSGGSAYRNDCYGAFVPVGNSSVWDQTATECLLGPVLLYPAVVRNPPHGVSQKSSAAVFGTNSRDIFTMAPIRSNPSKSLMTTVGAQNGDVTAAFRFQHSDDSAPVDWHCSEDLMFWDPNWFVFGKGANRGFFGQQAFAIPRPNAGTLLPGGHSLGSIGAFLICQDYAHYFYNPTTNPNQLGFATSQSAIGDAGQWFNAGSYLLNRSATSQSAPLGWRSTGAGSPGTWVPFYAPQRGEDTIAMADANQTATADQNGRRTLVLTGALTANRTLFLALPPSNAEGAEFVIDASGVTGHDVVVDVVSSPGTTVTIVLGKTATVRTNTSGVKRQTADV